MKTMRGKLSPLLAELHAHTTWSDGDYSVRELVDLYGALGFDVLCVASCNPGLAGRVRRGPSTSPASTSRARAPQPERTLAFAR
jgi:hypothetical protein